MSDRVPLLSRRAPESSGVLAAAVALGTGEFAAGLADGSPSPVVAVGEAVIDLTPGDAARAAIEAFGRNDKPALVIGTVVIALWVGMVTGRTTARRRVLGDVVFAVFGALGVAAALRVGDGVVVSVAPVVLAALAGAVTLRVLRFVAPPGAPGAPSPDRARIGAGMAERRVFLGFAGTAAVSALVLAAAGRRLRDRFSAVRAREALIATSPVRAAPPPPAGSDFGIDGLTPFITPNDDFYRIDTALTVPQVDPATWQLRITGLVDRPTSFTWDELASRTLVEVDATIACVSNEVGGELVGNAHWLGVRVDELLDEAGVDPRADQLIGRSVDGYTGGFPVALTRDRDAIVAIGMNGEPLPIDHGFPARLVTPGLYGYTSATKWLAELELSTFDAFDQYWVRRGWTELAPVKTQCRIDTPRGRQEAGTVAVAGVAWAPTRGIRAVEVQVDGGPWHEAELASVPGDDTWRQWMWRWEADPGDHVLRARATDGGGETQTDASSAPFPSGATGYPQRRVTVS